MVRVFKEYGPVNIEVMVCGVCDCTCRGEGRD
jgi:hypothetical protein